jgi:hypothetical protein
MKNQVLKTLPIRKNERSVRNSRDLKRDSESTVCNAGGNEFQQSIDLLKKEEKNLVEPSAGSSKIGRGILEERGGISVKICTSCSQLQSPAECWLSLEGHSRQSNMVISHK